MFGSGFLQYVREQVSLLIAFGFLCVWLLLNFFAGAH